MAFKSPRTNQIFSRSNKNSGALAAQSEATFKNNSNPQPELSARLDGLGSKAQEGATITSTRCGATRASEEWDG